MSDITYKLDELARAAGTSPRTVRYYVQRGLLPAPSFRGKDTAYAHEHLVRLRAIRRLQDAFLPLDAIAALLDRRSLAEIERIASGEEMPTVVRQTDEPLPSVLAVTPRPSALGATPRTPTSGRAHPQGSTFRRIELARGVELTIAEDAPRDSLRLVEKILEELQAK